MSAKLAAALVPSSLMEEKVKDFTNPSNKDNFFSLKERKKLDMYLDREKAPSAECSSQCKPNLFFGFFHDGTRNNFGNSISKKNHTHSNVARLYSCYPGRR